MLQLLSLTLFIIFLIKWLLKTPNTKKLKLPPSPPKLPIFGNLHQLGTHPHKSLRALSLKHGPLMLLKFGSKPVIIASTSEFAREIMKVNDISFSGRPKFTISDKLLYQGRDVSTAPYGEYWRQMRSICVLQLLSTKRVQSFRSIREEEVVLFVKKIDEFCSLRLPINLCEMFACFTNDVVCRVALGRKYSEGEGGKRFKQLLGDFMELLGAFTPGDFIPWLAWVNVVNGFDSRVDKIAKEFDKFLDALVEEHMARLEKRSKDESIERDDDHKNFVDVLLHLQKDHMVAGFSLDKVNIKALILDMFAAGTDTTYTVLEWAMSELLRHPKIMEQLQEELRKIAISQMGMIKETDLEKLPLLKATIKETLRLYPSIPLLVPRISSQDVKIKEYDIPAGTPVFTNAWAIARDPNIWDQPEDFNPHRFLNSSIDFKGHDFELIPFGAGRRGCPGIGFATTSIEILLANLLNKFNWSLSGGIEGCDLDMSESSGITIHRKIPLVAIATPRF